MTIIIASVILGTLLAIIVPYNIPYSISQYVAVALLAGFDSIFGGIVANLNNNFKLNIFISGFFGNSILAVLITYIGILLNADLYIAAILVFGSRLFQNFAIIRRFYLNKYEEKFNSKN